MLKSDLRSARLEALRNALANRNLIMGILNLTPDSFSDGGLFDSAAKGRQRAEEMMEEGADLIDIGAESSRPGAKAVPAQVQMDRILPVLEALRTVSDVPVSVDTRDEEVAGAALEAGADLINDISALGDSPGMAKLISRYHAGVVLMHMKGTPETMQLHTDYRDVVEEIAGYLSERAEYAKAAGISGEQIWIDPGIGFGKSVDGNLEILRRMNEIDRLGYPVVVGVSRKSFIGSKLDRQVDRRLAGTVAITAHLCSDGVRRIHRVHDVAENRDAARMIESLMEEPN